MQGTPEGQGHPCGWQVEGTEPADAYGHLQMKAGNPPCPSLAAENQALGSLQRVLNARAGCRVAILHTDATFAPLTSPAQSLSQGSLGKPQAYWLEGISQGAHRLDRAKCCRHPMPACRRNPRGQSSARGGGPGAGREERNGLVREQPGSTGFESLHPGLRE